MSNNYTLIMFFGLLGLCFGSFANVCILRLPLEESLWRSKSHCWKCKQPLDFRDNIPILSYLLLRGKCRTCGLGISGLYPLSEFIVALLFIGAYLLYGSWWVSAAILSLYSFYAYTITVIDYQHQIIPDELSLSLLVIGCLISPWNPFLGLHGMNPILEAVSAAFIGGGFMLLLAWVGEKLYKKEALGGGDIKFVAGIGALLGWDGILGALFLGSILGGLIGLGLVVFRKVGRKETIPFGPFLALGPLFSIYARISWLKFLFP